MASYQTDHPLPSPPGQAQQQYAQQYPQQYPQQLQRPQPQAQPQPQTRPRSKSTFSFRSDKSHKSNGSGGKIDLHESSQEKASRRLTSKADPLLAMSEAEPSAIASQTSSRLAPLRAIQHKDSEGLPISDPDRSNPTRSRWERPLDTIRAFEAAIDGNYSRKSFMRTESTPSVASYNNNNNNNMNRRSSYYAASNISAMNSRNPQEGYYGSSRPMSYRPDSYFDNQNYGGGRSNGYRPDRARYPRTASEPVFNAGMSVYPQNANHQSYETVTTASGSGSSADRDPQGYYTDPSSDNSSIDRGQAKPEHMENYGFNGFETQPSPQLQNYGQSRAGMQPNGGEQPYTNGHHGQAGPPPVPMHNSAPRVPIKLGTSSNTGVSGNNPGVYEPPRPSAGEKRKSWFGRRFSKQ